MRTADWNQMPRMLVADDSPAVTLLIERTFQTLGWDVTCVHDGLDALDEAMVGAYDLALLDHFMPTMLGAEVVQALQEANVDLPCIMLSGIDDDDTVVRYLELGAVDFLRKPFNTKELESRVKVQLARRAARS